MIPLKSPTVDRCTALADAAALTGYDFTVPDSVDGYPDVTIAVLESEQLTEVQYSSGNAALLRKAPAAMTSAEISTSMRKAMPLMLTAAA